MRDDWLDKYKTADEVEAEEASEDTSWLDQFQDADAEQPTENADISGFAAALGEPDTFKSDATRALETQIEAEPAAVAPDLPGYTKSADPNAVPDFDPDLAQDDTDDARAKRGFGRSNYMDDGRSIQLGDGGMIRTKSKPEPEPVEDRVRGENRAARRDRLAEDREIERARMSALPQQPEAEKDYTLGDVAKSSGSAAAAGATDIVASLPEAAAILQGDGAAAMADSNYEGFKTYQTQIKDINERLEADDLSPDEREMRERQLSDLKQGLDEIAFRSLRAKTRSLIPNQDREIYKMGNRMREASQDLFGTPDPRFDDFFIQKLSQGAGSMAGFVALTVLTGVAGGAVSGAAVNSAGMYRRAIQDGATEEQARASAWIGALVGTTEAIPIARALDMLPSAMRKDFAGKIGMKLTNILMSAGEEAAQEAAVEIANNITAMAQYNKEQDVFEGVVESATIGGILGGALGALVPTGKKAAKPRKPGAEQVKDLADEGSRILQEEGFSPEAPAVVEAPAPSAGPGGPGNAPAPLPVDEIEDDFQIPEGATPADVLYPVQEEAQTEPEAGAGAPVEEGAGEATQAQGETDVEEILDGPELDWKPIKKATINVPDGSKIEVEYAVVEADALTSSHNVEGKVNPQYPVTMQPRFRDEAESISQMQNIANSPDATRLGEAPFSSDGAPVVSRDGVVESGNGRVAGLQAAYSDRGTGERYKADLAGMGYSIEGYDKPILVRVRTTPMTPTQRQSFATSSNDPTTAQYSETELAQNDARRMSVGSLSLYRGGDLDSTANRDFMNAFAKEVLSEAQRKQFTTDGVLNAQGLRRVQAALLSKAYGSPELIQNIVEATDSRIKNIGTALRDIAPRWAQMRYDVQRGALPAENDFTPALLEAVNIVDRARREGRNVAEFMSQKDMFAGDAVSPLAREVMSLMFRNTEQWTQPVSAQMLIKSFRKIMEEIEKVGGGNDMFGGTTTSELIELGRKEQEKDDGQEQDALDLKPGDGGGAARGGDGQGKKPSGEAETSGAGGDAASQGSKKVDAANEAAGDNDAEASQADGEAGNADAADGGGSPRSGEKADAADADADAGGAGAGNEQALTPAEMLAAAKEKAKAQAEAATQDAVDAQQDNLWETAKRLAREAPSKLRGYGDMNLAGASPMGKLLVQTRMYFYSLEFTSQAESQLLSAWEDYVMGREKGANKRSGPKLGAAYDTGWDAMEKLNALIGNEAPRRTAAEAGKSAAKNTGSGLANAAKGLNALFGGDDPTRLNAGFTFDEETYKQAKVYFVQAIRDVGQAGQDIMEMVQAMVDGLIRSGITLETQEAMEPYQLKFIEDLQAGFDPFAEGDGGPTEMAALAEGFQDAFEDGEAFGSIVQARKRAGEILGRDIPETDHKMIEEGIEVGIVQVARGIAANNNLSVEEKYEAMVDLYQRQPKLAQRDSQSAMAQAYSTPAPLAYLASRLANLNPNQRVYEPSAGTGMLLMEVKPSKVTAVEMQPRRIEALNLTLGADATIIEGDATEVDVGGYKAVLANPPFGKILTDGRGPAKVFDLPGMDTEATTTEIDHAIAARALDGLPEGGKAVLIIGGQKGNDPKTRMAGYRSPKNRLFFKKLYDKYDVVEHFTVDGKMYERQGAGWPVDVIVIDGKWKSEKPYPMAVAPELFNNWEALGERLNGTRDSLDTREIEGAGGGDIEVGPAEAGQEPVREPADREVGGNAERGDDGAGGGAGADGVGGLDGALAGDQVADGQPEGGGAVDGDGGNGLSPVDGDGRNGLAREEGADQGRGGRKNAGGLDGGRGGAGGNAEVAGAARQAVERENKEVETDFQVQYEPRSNAEFSVGTLVPMNMQTAMTSALDDLQGRVGDIDDFVATELGYTRDELLGTKDKPGYFSAEQVDALALAIDNVQQAKGFIIGDQTGVGKGRFVAAMLRYAKRKGQVPVFITKDAGLFKDMTRDMRDIGEVKDIQNTAFVTDGTLRGKDKIELSYEEGDVIESLAPKAHREALTQIAQTGTLPDGKDMIWTTYSQLQQVRGQDTPRKAALRAIASKAMFVLDESHLAGGVTGERAGDGAQSRGDFVREIINQSRGVVFSSATYAKNPEVMSLYAPTDMAMAVESITNLQGIMERGGVPMQQVIANMLVETGQYARRERSFDGVEFGLKQLEVDKDRATAGAELTRQLFRLDTDYLQDARAAFIEHLAAGGMGEMADRAVGDVQFNSMEFASTMHNLVKQVLLALKTDAVVADAVAAHKKGEKPIITLSNTNASVMKEWMEEEGLKVGDNANIPLSAILLRYVERLRRVGYKDDNDKSQYIYMSDAEVKDFGGQRAYEELVAIKTLIKQQTEGKDAPLAGLGGSPIDKILDGLRDAGINVEEVTGRNLVATHGKIERREATIATKTRHMADFNSGKLDALVINRSGSTGFSLHARDAADNDGKMRHMIIAQAEENIDDFMQMLGRPHRTGQSRKPKFTVAVSDLALEKRPAAVLMRKMASLNANTTANRESAVTLDSVVDFLNPYGDRVVLDYLEDNPELAADLDLTFGVKEKSGKPKENLAQKFTNRISVMAPDQVAEIYDTIEEQYTDYLAYKDAAGENTLEAKVIELEAKTLNRAEIVDAVDESSPFGRAAYLEEVDAKKQGKPYTPDELQRILTARLQDEDGRVMTPDELSRDHAEKLDTARDKAVSQMSGKLIEYEAELAEARTKTQQDRAQDKINRLKSRTSHVVSTVSDVKAHLRSMKPGQIGMFRQIMPDGTKVSVPAFSFGGDISKLEDNPAAASNIKVSIAIAASERQVKLPLTGFIGAEPKYQFVPEPENNHAAFLSAFKEGQSKSRETRHIATGNLVTAFQYLDGKGQVVIYTDDKGAKKQGILLPATFDAEAAMEKRGVRLTPQQALEFVYAGDPVTHMVQTLDGVLSVQKSGNGQYLIQVNSRGRKPYTENGRVLDLIGKFDGRKGAKVWRYRTWDQNTARQVLEIYEAELGSKYETDTFRDAARALTGQSVPEMQAVEDGPKLRRAGLADASGQTIANEDLVNFKQTKLGSTTITAAYRANFKKRYKLVQAKLNAALNKANVNAKLQISDQLFGEDAKIDGVIKADGLAFRETIMIALEFGEANARRTVDHEILHFLRNPRNWGGRKFGLFTDQEWSALVAMAEADPEGLAEIKERYKHESYEGQIEEYIAKAYEDWAANNREVNGGFAAAAMRKIRAFFTAMRSALAGNGFTAPDMVFENPVDQVFSDIETGRIGSRAEILAEPIYKGPTEAPLMRRQAITDAATSQMIDEAVRFSVNHNSTPQERQYAATRGLGYYALNPAEAALRVLTMPIGGVDQYGKLRAGKWVEGQVQKTVLEREFSDKTYLRYLNPMARRVRAGVIDRHGLDPNYVERERQKGVDEANLARRGMEYVQNLLDAKMDPAEYKVIQQILTNEAPRQEEWDALTEPVREAIEQLGFEAMQLGMISRESYERNKGAYLHRVYKKHEATEDRIGKAAREWGSTRRSKIIGDQLKGRGLFDTVETRRVYANSKSFQEGRIGAPKKGDEVLVMARRSKPRNQAQLNVGQLPDGPIVEKVYLDPNDPIPGKYQNWESLGIFEMRGTKGKDKVVLWRDYNMQERQEMGEVLDARYTLAKTFQLMSRDIATGRFFKDIAENEEWARKMPPDGANIVRSKDLKSALGGRMFADLEAEWIEVPKDTIGESGARKFGALAGMYVRAEIWRDMQELDAIQTPNAWKRILTFWKLNKTARSIGVHMNNIVSNFIFMDMAGVRKRDLFRAIVEMRKGGAMYQEAMQNGAFGADYVTQEIQTDILEPLLRELNKEMQGGKDNFEARLGFIGKVGDGIASRIRKIDASMLKAYQMEDQVFRMATYIRRREQGMQAQEAAVEARDQFLNYDIRAPWVNAARNSALPFISYSYRAIPRIMETIMTRPWKLAKYYGLYYALSQMAYMLAPSDWEEEEERGALRADQKSETWLGIPMTDYKVPRMIRMPMLGGTEGDLPVYLDIRRWIPAGDVFEVNGETGVPPWLAIGGPIVMVFEQLTNQNTYFREDISDPTDPATRQVTDRLSHLWSGWAPSYAPGIPYTGIKGSYHFERVKEALTKNATRFGGQPYTLGEAIGNAAGVKMQPLDVEAGYDIHGMLFSMAMRKSRAEQRALDRQFYDRGRISEAEYLAETKLLDQKIDRALKEYEELVDLRD